MWWPGTGRCERIAFYRSSFMFLALPIDYKFCPICNFPELFMERGEFPRKFACFPEAEEATRLVHTKWTGKLGGDQRGNSCQKLITLEDTAPGRRELSDPRVHSGGPWSSCWSLRKSILVHHFECSWAKSLHVRGWCRMRVPHFMEMTPMLETGWLDIFSRDLHHECKASQELLRF